jgi:hypothetical protein
MHEGPGVSISLVGGRNSSIGFIMTSNLSFHGSMQGRQKDVPQENCGDQRIGPLAKALVPNAFRDLTPKYAPDQD